MFGCLAPRIDSFRRTAGYSTSEARLFINQQIRLVEEVELLVISVQQKKICCFYFFFFFLMAAEAKVAVKQSQESRLYR